jgi:hypothetical protein
VAEQRAAPGLNFKVAQGATRTVRIPEPHLYGAGTLSCPRTGVWCGQVVKDHPQAARYNRIDRQAYVEKGQAFPAHRAMHMLLKSTGCGWTTPLSRALPTLRISR